MYVYIYIYIYIPFNITPPKETYCGWPQKLVFKSSTKKNTGPLSTKRKLSSERTLVKISPRLPGVRSPSTTSVFSPISFIRLGFLFEGTLSISGWLEPKSILVSKSLCCWTPFVLGNSVRATEMPAHSPSGALRRCSPEPPPWPASDRMTKTPATVLMIVQHPH